MGKTTITVQEDTLERFNRIKQEADDAEPACPDTNADFFLGSLLDTWEKVEEVGYGGDSPEWVTEGNVEVQPLYGLDDVLEAVRTIEERTGRIERTLEDITS